MTNQLLIIVTFLVTLTTLLVISKCVKKETVFTAVLAIVFGVACKSYSPELSTERYDIGSSVVMKKNEKQASTDLRTFIKDIENTMSVTYQTLTAFSLSGFGNPNFKMYKIQIIDYIKSNLGQTKYDSTWLTPRTPPPQINSS